jgi:PPOX class probable F420-dependent enzyme
VDAWVAEMLDVARVAHLGTVSRDGAVRLVPMCFAIVDGWLGSAVDYKPKRTAALQRLDDIERAGTATVLIDQYEEDWSRLWWIRIRGRGTVHRDGGPEARSVIAALVAKYPQYEARPPTGAVYRIALDDVRWWRPSAQKDRRGGWSPPGQAVGSR